MEWPTHHIQYSRTLKIIRMDASNPTNPFEIPELLEKVLLYLTQGEILQVQRVNRFWRDTIFESPSLQQKLFFQPLPPSKVAGRLPQWNPIVEALFPFLFTSNNQPYLGPFKYKDMAEEMIQHWAGDPIRRQAILRPEASWRLMLPVQPAAPIDGLFKIGEHVYDEGDGYDDWNVYDDWDDKMLEWCGVDPSRHASASASRSDLGTNATTGLLYDIVLHYFSSCISATGIHVQWNMFDTRCHKMSKLGKHEKQEPRNTITIHVNPIAEGTWPVPIPSSGLRAVLALPVGVVGASNKANRYPGGCETEEYWEWGRLAPELESELDKEWRQSRESGESELLALHWETY